MTEPNYLVQILNAPVYDVAIETPLDPSVRLSQRLKNSVFLKREDLQPVFSFKLRGAYNCMVQLSEIQRAMGVVASSAGNHAQGVALSAAKLDIDAHIVMPVTTPSIKVDAVRKFGAEVILFGDDFDAAKQHAGQLAEKHGWTNIHPFDDPHVIAGQGTIGLEILRQFRKPIKAVFVAIGGGGMAAGIGSYIKAVRPEILVIGVEPQDAASMSAAFAAGKVVDLSEVGTFADGVAVRRVGDETFRVCREVVDEIIQCDTDEICAAIKDVFEDTRSILEPAGALSVAGLKKYIKANGWSGENVVAIACGANMNFDRLRHVSERAEIGETREGLFAVTLPEQPGSFRTFIRQLGDRDVSEFNYRYSEGQSARVFVGVKIDNCEEFETLLEGLNRADFASVNLLQNEMAKLHLRHMVGGRAVTIQNELIFRFEFPERSGALSSFLDRMGENWNISLFHYRNHGSNVARVLVGIQVPPEDREEFSVFLDQLGFKYTDETDNPAVGLFLH